MTANEKAAAVVRWAAAPLAVAIQGLGYSAGQPIANLIAQIDFVGPLANISFRLGHLVC
jgi:hypothetical protein